MTRQAEIDRICKWMGRQTFHTMQEDYWTWHDESGKEQCVEKSRFNPFTSPADCAVVMDEVERHKWTYHHSWFARKRVHWVQIIVKQHSREGWSKISECEAKMLALGEAIKEG